MIYLCLRRPNESRHGWVGGWVGEPRVSSNDDDDGDDLMVWWEVLIFVQVNGGIWEGGEGEREVLTRGCRSVTTERTEG